LIKEASAALVLLILNVFLVMRSAGLDSRLRCSRLRPRPWQARQKIQMHHLPTPKGC